MSQNQSIALVAVLVLGLAAVAMSASIEQQLEAKLESTFGSLVCDTCKNVISQSKDQLPALKEQLEQFCHQVAKSDELVKKCLMAVDGDLDDLAKKSPEEICQGMGLCTKAGALNNVLGL